MIKLLILLHLVFTSLEVSEPTVSIQSIKEDKPSYEIYEVTAYTLREEETGKGPDHPEFGITSSGARAQVDKTLACPPSLDFGTKIYIPYFDITFECQDRGGAITEGKLDVFFGEGTEEDVAGAFRFGRRYLEVQILDREEELDVTDEISWFSPL